MKFWKPNPPELKVVIVERPTTHLRADEFRADKELVHLAATVLANPNMQLLLSVMHNEHPAFEVLPTSADTIQRVVQQAKCEGFSICLATLESLGIKANLPERLVSTFGATEPAEQQTG
jgi:hypothetical protein